MHAPRAIQITLGSEDGSANAARVVGHIVSATLRIAHPQSPDLQFLWHYCPTKDGPWRALRKNLWKSTNQRDHHAIVEFVRTIAYELLREDRVVFVVLHVDGDTSWRARKTSENALKFEEIVRKRVRMVLLDHLSSKKPALDSDAEIARRMTRLVLAMPFYSIEAWLYQATECAIRLCRSHHQGRDIKTFRDWGADRASLDEEKRPKEMVCLGSEHNLTLAEEFPAQIVLAIEKSYFAFAKELTQALTYNPAAPGAVDFLPDTAALPSTHRKKPM